MPEQRSALASIYCTGPIGPAADAAVVMFERLCRSLVQVSGWADGFEPVCQKLEALLSCPVPQDCRRATSREDRSIFRVGPERVWLTGPLSDEWLREIDTRTFADEAVVTELGQSRTVMRIEGPGARALLNRGLPIDLDDAIFDVGSFAQSAIHHIPVLVHRVDGAGAFDVYVAREYAASLWEWLTEAVQSIGCRINEIERPLSRHAAVEPLAGIGSKHERHE
jgi:sarcosine oxidase subunit gamma